MRFVRDNGTGRGNLSCPTSVPIERGRRWAQSQLNQDLIKEANTMEEKNEARIKTLLSDVDKEFRGLNHYRKAKFAIEQISMWQQKFNEAKGKILSENIVDATHTSTILSSYPELDA